MKKDQHIIFCDGAAKGNPGPGGWGAIIASDVEVVEIGGSDRGTTNNRMELTAAINALRLIPKNGSAVVYTDSSYVAKGITSWLKSWIKNGWRTATKKAVENQDLWQELEMETVDKELVWKVIPGHAGIPGNMRVDEIASMLALGATVRFFNGPRSLYTVDLSPSVANFQKSSKGAAYSYVSMVDGSIKTHKTWKECEKRVKGKAALFRKTFSTEDEKRIMEEFKKRQ